MSGAGPMDRFHAGIYSCYTSRLELGRLGHLAFRFPHIVWMARRRGAGPMDRFHADIYSSCGRAVLLGRFAFRVRNVIRMARDGWRGAGPMDRFHAGIYIRVDLN
jgi:hypothetical protein